MFIVRPSFTKPGGMGELLRPHPPPEKRIAKLIEQMGDANPYAANG